MLTGGCHCGAVRFEAAGEPSAHHLCHCTDCQRTSGAPMVAWITVQQEDLTLTGEPAVYASSEGVQRYFCIQCGTGLFYANFLRSPGTVDIQTAVLDEPDDHAPTAHIHTADQLGWMNEIRSLPKHAGFADDTK